MSTATETEVDELYATFLSESAEDDEACESDVAGQGCSRQAVFVFRWQADGRLPFDARCGCARVTKQCLSHGEAYMATATSSMVIECLRCARFMLPHHVDKLRRTA